MTRRCGLCAALMPLEDDMPPGRFDRVTPGKERETDSTLENRVTEHERLRDPVQNRPPGAPHPNAATCADPLSVGAATATMRRSGDTARVLRHAGMGTGGGS